MQRNRLRLDQCSGSGISEPVVPRTDQQRLQKCFMRVSSSWVKVCVNGTSVDYFRRVNSVDLLVLIMSRVMAR